MKKVLFLSIFSFILFTLPALAAPVDSDFDGISDEDETNTYFTDPQNADTDGDGYDDGLEIRNWHSPLHKDKAYRDLDSDNDGLNDELELRFKTNMFLKDTDGDGYDDGLEVDNGYNPRSATSEKLTKRIVILTKEQRLNYLLDGIKIGELIVSTGKYDSTPKGEFEIGTKIKRAWSRSAKLWMPYWMPFDRHLYGIHELPEWPNGVKEGEDHLGKAVSGGCVRVGIGAAKFLYEWTPEGTVVEII